MSPDFVSQLFGDLSLGITATASSPAQVTSQLAPPPAHRFWLSCALVATTTIKHLDVATARCQQPQATQPTPGTQGLGPAAEFHTGPPAQPSCALPCAFTMFLLFFSSRTNAKFEFVYLLFFFFNLHVDFLAQGLILTFNSNVILLVIDTYALNFVCLFEKSI